MEIVDYIHRDAEYGCRVRFGGAAAKPPRPSVRKFAVQNFKRPKNREDSSDFDDFLTESIAAP